MNSSQGPRAECYWPGSECVLWRALRATLLSGRNRCRSGDLAVFSRALYQLSYPTADLTGFEPATSGLTGRRALQTAPQVLVTRRSMLARRASTRSGPSRPLWLLVPRPALAQKADGVVLDIDDPLLHGDDGVIGDLDVFRADLGTALGDVAEPEASLFADEVLAVQGVVGVHVELRVADEEAGPGERRLVFLVVSDDMAGVLAQKALDALAELLRALHIDLLHPERRLGLIGAGGEGRHLGRLDVVEAHVGDQVPDDGEAPQRRDGDRFARREGGQAGQAHQAGTSVDFRRARSA